MISLNGAKKLINHPNLQKINYHLDHTLAYYVYNNKDYNIYSLNKQFVYQNSATSYSDLQNNIHPLMSTLTNKIKIGNTYSLGTYLSLELIYLRKINMSITFFLIALFGIQTLIYIFNKKSIFLSFLGILYYYIFEFLIINNFVKFNSLMKELLLLLCYTYFLY